MCDQLSELFRLQRLDFDPGPFQKPEFIEEHKGFCGFIEHDPGFHSLGGHLRVCSSIGTNTPGCQYHIDAMWYFD